MHLSLSFFGPPMKRILLALDLREPLAFTQSVEALAAQMGADLYALHVVPPPEVAPFSGYEGLVGIEGLPYAMYDPQVERDLADAEEDALNRFLSERFTRPVRAACRPGDPAAVILDDAKGYQADLIVLGHRHRGFMERMLAGSVALSVLRESPLPVLLFPIAEHH